MVMTLVPIEGQFRRAGGEDAIPSCRRAETVPSYLIVDKVPHDAWLAGVDGCPAGWLVAFARSTGREVRLRIVPRFADVLDAPEKAAVIAIDIPIGLPGRVGRGGRVAENLVRPFLGGRQ